MFVKGGLWWKMVDIYLQEYLQTNDIGTLFGQSPRGTTCFAYLMLSQKKQNIGFFGTLQVAYEPESTTEDVPLFEAIASATQVRETSDAELETWICMCCSTSNFLSFLSLQGCQR